MGDMIGLEDDPPPFLILNPWKSVRSSEGGKKQASLWDGPRPTGGYALVLKWALTRVWPEKKSAVLLTKEIFTHSYELIKISPFVRGRKVQNTYHTLTLIRIPFVWIQHYKKKRGQGMAAGPQQSPPPRRGGCHCPLEEKKISDKGWNQRHPPAFHFTRSLYLFQLSVRPGSSPENPCQTSPCWTPTGAGNPHPTLTLTHSSNPQPWSGCFVN